MWGGAPWIHGPLQDHIPTPWVLILVRGILVVLEIEGGEKIKKQLATVSAVWRMEKQIRQTDRQKRWA